jgi:hypothetical protein
MKTHDNLQMIKPYLGSAEDDMMRVGRITLSPSHERSVHSIHIYAVSDRVGPGHFKPANAVPVCRSAVLPLPPSFPSKSQHIHTHFYDHFVETLHTLKKSSYTFRFREKLTMLSATRTRSLVPMGKVLRAVSTWSNVPAGPPDPILGRFRRSTPRSLYSIGLTD